jgi:hypothetical protein
LEGDIHDDAEIESSFVFGPSFEEDKTTGMNRNDEPIAADGIDVICEVGLE